MSTHSRLNQTVSSQNLLRKTILNVTTLVVSAVGSGAAVLIDSLVLPMLEVSTDIQRPENDFLIEDGLELWQVTTGFETLTLFSICVLNLQFIFMYRQRHYAVRQIACLVKILSKLSFNGHHSC